MHWSRARDEFCEDDTVLVRRHVKVLHLQHVLAPSLGDMLMVQHNIDTNLVERLALLNAYYALHYTTRRIL